MTKKLIFHLTSLAILFISISLKGQSSFQNLSERSSQVIEARVVDQATFKSDKNGHIYTRNTLEVLKVFKGENKERLEIITLGGTIDNEKQASSHSFGLYLNDKGVFFLDESKLFESTYIPMS